MPSHWTNAALAALMKGTLDLEGDVLKLALVKTSYVPSKDDATAAAITAHELGVEGYAKGFGGAGRKVLAGKAVTQDDANDRATWTATDPTWVALATGETIGGAVLIRESVDDAGSLLVAWIDLPDTPTNGSPVTVDLAAAALTLAG